VAIDRFKGTCVVAKWHRPLCTWCRRPIEDINFAYAGWYETATYETIHPQVVHSGATGCRYYHEYPNGHRHGLSIMDVQIPVLRRAPMEAIAIAMRRRAESESEQLVWNAWLSVSLGLPFADYDLLGWLEVNGEVGERLITCVPFVHEVVAGRLVADE